MYECVRLMSLLQILNVVEGRVYCQDSHASPWVPFGYSCPVLCQNIINAIERLKIMDFENIIYQKPFIIPQEIKKTELLTLPKDEINEIDIGNDHNDNTVIRTDMNKYRKWNMANFKNRIPKSNEITAEDLNNINPKAQNKMAMLFQNKILKSKQRTASDFKNNIKKMKSNNINHSIDENSFYKDVIKLVNLAGKTFNGRCRKSNKVDLVGMMKCARKSNIDGSFLIIMTKLLNKYANSVYKFTEDMTEVLLQKIFGENTDLRNNIFDVSKLLGYLRQALHEHKKHEHRDVIALSSKQCLTISLPGCFCKSGFVESSGQCVKPSDCVEESLYDEYLARVVVT